MSIAPDIHELRGASAFANDVRIGLGRRPKSLPSMYFYDERGSRLFQQITEQPEYYLTRCEHEILTENAALLADMLAVPRCHVFEIGAGDGLKTETLLRGLLAAGLRIEYSPIDICRAAVIGLTDKLRNSLSDYAIDLHGIVADFHDTFPLIQRQSRRRRLVLFLGSSIGNFDPWRTRRFLDDLRGSLSAGDLALIGFDLQKEREQLIRAYDDAAGVTREFNYNLLDRINRELGGRFDRRRFVHRAVYNERLNCMESWLVSDRRQRVGIETLGTSFDFATGEGMRVERSFKYTLSQIEKYAAESGFVVRRHLVDRQAYFVDSLWEASPTT